jgi:N-acetylneuraminic acid mutarotase
MISINLARFCFIILIFVMCYFLFFSVLQTSQSEVTQTSWFNARNMPTQRSEIAATNIEGSIFVIGGFDGSGKALDTVEIYNVYNDSWKKIAALPEPLHHTVATNHKGKVYVVGGFTSDAGDWVPTNKLFIYDTQEDKWKEGRPMPTARGALTAVFVNETLFAIGGQQSSDIDSSEILNTNEAYDPITDTWKSEKSMPTSRHHAASSAVEGKIYVMGGRTFANSSMINLNTNEMYNPEKNEWIVLEPMPSKRSGLAAASYNDSIFLFGGEDAGGMNPKTYGNNEVFSPATGFWTSKQSLPTPRHGLSATTVDSKIFVIGGGPEAGLSTSNINEVFNPSK